MALFGFIYDKFPTIYNIVSRETIYPKFSYETMEDKRTEKRKIGDIGEQIACEWLENRGFKVSERNYLKSWGEIDIVSRRANILHFIEVKTVSRENLEFFSHETSSYRPEDNIHPAKLKRLSRVIQGYLLERGIGDEVEWQFDAMSVYLDQKNKKAKVEFLENLIL